MLKAQSAFLAALLVLSACEGGGQVIAGVSSTNSTDNRPQEIQDLAQYPHKNLCVDTGEPGVAHCMAKVRTDDSGNVATTTAPQGLAPTDLESAYAVPGAGGTGLTVAIVDAQDNPSAEADLGVYRAQYGLPACTTANGCFRKVNQTGQQSNYPTADQGWSGEISLDLDMVSAICPACNILLVEANSATQDDLGTALNTAVSLGAVAVSNSYGGSESSSNSTYDSEYFNHPGVAITVSAGDDGYGVEYPASSAYVTAVGGTSLARSMSNSRGWVEAAWGSANNANGGTGSGCSQYTTKPGYQSDSSCSNRMVADVSAVADPNTGVAVYDQYGSGGWIVVGGTSAASPIVASMLALTGHTGDALGFSYANTGDFYDVTTGVNGTCTTAYFCSGEVGYDGPTGNGTPNGAAMASTTPGSGSSTTGSTPPPTGITGGTGSSGTPDAGPVGSTGGSGSTGSAPSTGGVCASCTQNSDCQTGYCDTVFGPGFCDSYYYCQTSQDCGGSVACNTQTGDCRC